MRKKNYMAVTFILAGAMVACGAGILSYRISGARTENVEVRVDKEALGSEEEALQEEGTEGIGADKQEVPESEGTALQEKGAEDTNADTGRTDMQQEARSAGDAEKKGLYLPKDAVLEKETKRGDETEYIISWDGHHIVYVQGADSLKAKKSDLSISDAIVTAQKFIADYGSEDAAGAEIWLSLLKNVAESKKEEVDNKKNYGIRYYDMYVSGIKDHQYHLEVNSITGEVFTYTDFYEVTATKEEIIQNRVIYDGYTEQTLGYVDPEDAKKAEKLYSKAKKLYSPVAKEFVRERLNLGEVTECFGFMSGYIGGSPNGGRDVMVCYCRTEGSDVVELQIDQITNTVRSIVINPLYY